MARGRAAGADLATLQMALVGYEIERRKIEEKIREIRQKLGKRGGQTGSAKQPAAPRRKRNLSAEARRRIAQAQKRRWAEHHKRMAQAGKNSKK